MQIPKRNYTKQYEDIKDDPHITQKEVESLEKELNRLKTSSQSKAIKEVQRLAEMGDFSENHAYQLAKGKLRGINNRMLVIEKILTHAIIIEEGSNDGVIRIGSKVVIKLHGKKQEFQILGPQEADPKTGSISYKSPIGSAIMGEKKGSIVQAKIGDTTKKIQILDVL